MADNMLERLHMLCFTCITVRPGGDNRAHFIDVKTEIQ